MLLTDPFGSLPKRVLILRVEPPRYIFEINHPDDTENVQEVTVAEQTYRVAIRRKLTDDKDIPLSFFKDVARWYHYSKQESSELEE